MPNCTSDVHEIRSLADLTPDIRNANKGTPRGREMVEQSLRESGAGRSVLVDRQGRLIAGNKTTEAAYSIGLDDVVVVQTDGTKVVVVQRTDLDLETDVQARRLAVADNRTGEVGLEWDAEALLAEMQAGVSLDGLFREEELAELLDSLQTQQAQGDPDEIPETPAEPVTKRGDIITLGRHRLMCGDATDRADIATLMDGKQADMCFTDPPYGVAVSGAGGRAIEGDLGNVAISGFFPLAVNLIKPGRALYMCGGSSNVPLFFKLYEIHCHQLPSIIVWAKEHFVMRHHDYHAQFEFVYYGWVPGGAGAKDRWFGDRKQTDLWQMRRDAASDYEHPTQKPVELAERAILNSSPTGGVIYEPFCGSGSTMIACEMTGRECYALELDPRYCDVIIERYQRYTGQTVERAA